MSRDTAADVAAILHPLPRPAPGELDHDGFIDMRERAAADRDETAEQLRLSWEEGAVDPLLAALAQAYREKQAAEQLIRQLLAYGREFVLPRGYTLETLAAACDMSVSGVRTAYGPDEIKAVADATGARPRKELPTPKATA
jgi:hypothetical protein